MTIKDFLEENVPLQDLLEKNILELQEKMNELNGAIQPSIFLKYWRFFLDLPLGLWCTFSMCSERCSEKHKK